MPLSAMHLWGAARCERLSGGDHLPQEGRKEVYIQARAPFNHKWMNRVTTCFLKRGGPFFVLRGKGQRQISSSRRS